MCNLVAIQFHDQNLLATLVNSVPYVALKPICENIGIDWEAQRQKIDRHPVLNSTACMIKAVAADGKIREMFMMPLEYLNGWLFGIDVNRVKEEIKPRVIEYQTECFKVLANHFMPKLEPEKRTRRRHYTLEECKQVVEQHGFAVVARREIEGAQLAVAMLGKYIGTAPLA
jgi:P22_AR N-terminal domain